MVSLPLLIAVTAVVIAVSAGTVAALSLYASSRHAVEANLTLLARSRADAVSALLGSVRQDLVNAAGNPLVEHALDNIAVAVKIMPPERRAAVASAYRADVEQARKPDAIRPLDDYYGRAHDIVHPWFKALAAEVGYPDILFIDRDGNVAYALAKRSDFGGNINDEALRGSVLADLFARVSAGKPWTTDFRSYGPAGGAAAFSGVPLFEQFGSRQQFAGMLAVQLPRGRIDAILNDPDGFGAAGEAALVGEDGLLRSDSRFGSRDDVLRRGLTGDAAPAAGNAILEIAGLGGRRMIAAASPVVNGDLRGSVVAAESADEVFQPLWRMTGRIAAICLTVALLLALFAVRMAGRIARPVLDLNERFDAALSNMQHGLVMVDEEGRLILCNTAYVEMYQLPPALTEPGTPIALIDVHRRALGMATAEPLPRGGYATGRYELPDGRTIDVVRKALPSGGAIAVHENITTTVHAQKQITYLATHDALTGLLNRSSLMSRMSRALDRVRGAGMTAVFCLDLDYFKAVNDMLGHPVGDMLLRAVASRLITELAGETTLARLGGDEFVILQDDIERPEEARDLAERLIRTIATPFDLDGHQVAIGLSVGIAMAPADGTDADSLLKNADLALYRAKADGRGTCRFFEAAMDAELQARRQLEIDLRHALTEQQFELAYQPVYDAVTEVITGVEALLRWPHPERGLVPPADFIPVAEDMGLIVPIGEWVMRKACMDAARWPASIRVAVNLSPLQLKAPDLVAMIMSALADAGLSPLRLEIEITESVLLSDDEATLAALHRLKSLGLRIAMDDFGTGYSSLSYLRSFPFDKIKIDQSFVRELGDRADSIAIIKAISELGASLDMATTVEGVETVEQLHIVRKQGCTEVQGYLMCRPISGEQIGALLDARRDRPRLTA